MLFSFGKFKHYFNHVNLLYLRATSREKLMWTRRQNGPLVVHFERPTNEKEFEKMRKCMNSSTEEEKQNDENKLYTNKNWPILKNR